MKNIEKSSLAMVKRVNLNPQADYDPVSLETGKKIEGAHVHIKKQGEWEYFFFACLVWVFLSLRPLEEENHVQKN